MYTLFIDTHSHLITIALINKKECFKYEKESDRSHSKILLPLIKTSLEEHNLTLNNIEKIIIVNGPGSFTGIRIGLSVAKTIGYALNIPVIPISSLEAFLVSDSSYQDKLSIIEDGNSYYYSVFNQKNKVIIKESYSSLIPKELKQYNQIKNILDIEKIYKYTKNKKSVNIHSLKANYIKQVDL